MSAERIHRRRPSPWVVVLAFVMTVLAAGPAAAQTVIFEDGFQVGTAGRWSSVEPPILMVCNCYFSGDCLGGEFCDWGVLSAEDNCTFAEPKPFAVPGAGCNVDFPGPWQLGICDGRCVPTGFGSSLGVFDPAVLAQGVLLWSEAVLRPAAAGGGPVDPELAAQALALPIGEVQSIILGRQTVSLIVETADLGFYDYFCHFEAGDPSPRWWVSLTDECSLMAGRLASQALAAELSLPGSGASLLAEIPLYCEPRQMRFGATCPAGSDSLSCLEDRVGEFATFLTTPRTGALFVDLAPPR